MDAPSNSSSIVIIFYNCFFLFRYAAMSDCILVYTIAIAYVYLLSMCSIVLRIPASV